MVDNWWLNADEPVRSADDSVRLHQYFLTIAVQQSYIAWRKMVSRQLSPKIKPGSAND